MESVRKELREEFYAELEKLKNAINVCKQFEPLITDNKDNIGKLTQKIKLLEVQI